MAATVEQTVNEENRKGTERELEVLCSAGCLSIVKLPYSMPRSKESYDMMLTIGNSRVPVPSLCM
jgi:hypothetical protein